MRLTLITSELLCLDEQLLRNQVYELILIQKKKVKRKKKNETYSGVFVYQLCTQTMIWSFKIINWKKRKKEWMKERKRSLLFSNHHHYHH